MKIKPSQSGFSLIELMIALVVGLIVSGAAVALVAAIGKSNADTVRATRLTQELRATAEVIAREMRRARSTDDPIATVSSPTPVPAGMQACNNIDTSTAGCVVYGYDCKIDPQTNVFQTGTFFSIGLVGSKVFLKGPATAVPACPTAGDTQISSSAVNISTLTFSPQSATGANSYTITVAGQLSYQPSVTNSVTITNPTRTISQEVRIRSLSVQ